MTNPYSIPVFTETHHENSLQLRIPLLFQVRPFLISDQNK